MLGVMVRLVKASGEDQSRVGITVAPRHLHPTASTCVAGAESHGDLLALPDGAPVLDLTAPGPMRVVGRFFLVSIGRGFFVRADRTINICGAS